MADLRSGMSGSDVQNMQLKLIAASIYHNRADFNLPQYGADGQFGQETLQAVLNFQRALGLTPDGIVGFQTMNALDAIIDMNPDEVTFNTNPYSKITGQPVKPPIVVTPPPPAQITTASGAVVQQSQGLLSGGAIDWKVIGIGAAVIMGMFMFMDPGGSGRGKKRK